MTNTKTASNEELESLHAELARTLKKGLAIVDPDTGAPHAALLNVARQFLKDNKIEATAPKGSPLGELAGLPVFEDGMPDTATPAH